MVTSLSPGGARAVERCDLLASTPFSDISDGLFRSWLSPAFEQAQKRIAEWMSEAGMVVRTDAATNLIGRYPGNGDGPALIIASHLDSVRHAGAYDGPLGIMLGIECVAALHGRGEFLPFPIEVMAFGDEEGSRFPAAMITSRAAAGTLDPTPDMTDNAGIALVDALAPFGTSPGRLADARHAPALAYLEAHIEQGPVLDKAGLALAVVTGIAAQLRFRIELDGQAGHAGTTTMALRCDALAAAAEIILAVERLAVGGPEDLVATVGVIDAKPGAPNVIAGHTAISLDVRALDPALRDRTASAIIAEAQAIAARRGVRFRSDLVHDLSASPCDPRLIGLLSDAMVAERHPSRRLASGAGHDAMVMAALCPTAMLFIRCRDGISHNPAEQVEPADADAALRVMLGFIDRLGATFA